MILSDPLFNDGNVRLTTVSLKPLCVCCIICVCKLPKSWQSAETVGVCAVYSVQSQYSAAPTGIFSRLQVFGYTYLFTRRTHKGFKGTIVNPAFLSLHGESLEITLIVPLK